jgi:hypothetical protein
MLCLDDRVFSHHGRLNNSAARSPGNQWQFRGLTQINMALPAPIAEFETAPVTGMPCNRNEWMELEDGRQQRDPDYW